MTPDWLQPLPWLQMAREKEAAGGGIPQMPVPGLVGAITNGGLDLYNAWRNRPQGRGAAPPPRKYRTLSSDQIARSAGDYANSMMGAPPPMY